MARDRSEMKNWHSHRGKGLMFAGVIVIILGLATYYNFSWPLVLVLIGILLFIFGLSKMVKS